MSLPSKTNKVAIFQMTTGVYLCADVGSNDYEILKRFNLKHQFVAYIDAAEFIETLINRTDVRNIGLVQDMLSQDRKQPQTKPLPVSPIPNGLSGRDS